MKSKWIFFLLTILAALASGGVMIVTAQGPTPGGRRAPAAALGTAFTYQGQLKSGGILVNGNCDFQFGLWDSQSGGTQLGVTQTLTTAPVANGLFTVQLNGGGEFGGSAFNGDARYLQIAVGCPSPAGTLTSLNSREQLTAAPYAQYSVTSGFATSAGSALTANSVITPTLRRYYLTPSGVDGSHTITACVVGYHMASLWEIFNVSGLLYDTNLGYTSSADQGSGPPILGGWVRTGGASLSNNFPGNANCNAWTTNSSSMTGTYVILQSLWGDRASSDTHFYVDPWHGSVFTCDNPIRVWCVQNLP